MRRPMLVDLNNFFFRFFLNHKPIHRIAEDCLNNLMSFQESLACTDTIIFADYGKSTYRLNLYPEYKGNRKTDDAEKEAQMKKHFANQNYTLKVLEAYFPVIKIKGIEADDTIAYCIINKFSNAVILSADQDMLQLNATQFSPNRADFISLDKLDFDSPRQFITAKALAGDNSDNITGLERVGMKTALKYLRKYDTDNYEELRERIPKNTKSKIEQRILDGQEIINRNEKLVNLLDYNDEIIGAASKEIDEALEPENELDWMEE